jgi:hypothetical protein
MIEDIMDYTVFTLATLCADYESADFEKNVSEYINQALFLVGTTANIKIAPDKIAQTVEKYPTLAAMSLDELLHLT